MSSDVESTVSTSATAYTNYPPNFTDIIITDWPNPRKAPGPGKGRASKGPARYSCSICKDPPYTSMNKSNAATHVRTLHSHINSRLDESPQSVQRSISSMLSYVPSTIALRNAFNREAYLDAATRLMSVHRLPFSAIEWEAMKAMALACNPAIDDQLITS